jgi:hypothetical protein
MAGSIRQNTDGGQENSSMDFEGLRAKGIALIQEMAGDEWTDFNLHDPGVTILEQLCFALTDLAYQTDFDIADLLTEKKGDINFAANSFFSRPDILTVNPVTVNDYRRAMIDALSDKIDNIWFIPAGAAAHEGLYDIIVQPAKRMAGNLPDHEKTIRDAVRATYNAKRNLGEDIHSITILRPLEIAIKASVGISSHIVAEELVTRLYLELEDEISKPVKFYSEAEMLSLGYRVEDIFCGPKLTCGFIPDRELTEKSNLIENINIMKRILSIAGVEQVVSLTISVKGQPSPGPKIPVLDSEFAFLQISKEDISSLEIEFFSDKHGVPLKNKLYIQPSKRRVEIHPDTLNGTYRNTRKYHSLQNYFPAMYGIGRKGLLKSAPAERKAQAKQLKAYLMLFEQVLANYLAQLDHLNEFFSNETGEDHQQTYFVRALYTVPGASEILKAFTSQDALDWDTFQKHTSNDYMRNLQAIAESKDDFYPRKNRMLDHLMARFNEHYSTYPFKLYCDLYGGAVAGNRDLEAIKWKSAQLRAFDKINYNRVRARDYSTHNTSPEYDRDPAGSVYDFESKMRRLLFIDEPDNPVSEIFKDGGIGLGESGTIKNEQQGAANQEQGAGGSAAPKQDEKLARIFLDASQAKDLQFDDTDQGNGPSTPFAFMNQPISVLKYAMDISNYRVVPGTGPAKENQHLLLYKSPEPEDLTWVVVGRGERAKFSLETLKTLTEKIRQVNIRSERFYLVEHILLRPSGYQPGSPAIANTYLSNFKMTVVLPAWPARSQDPNFRNWAQALFRLHAPAHLLIDFKWLEVNPFINFEKHYHERIKALAAAQVESALAGDALDKANHQLSSILGIKWRPS